ncbi:hypothetical protein M885DRAFT_626072 [Pelagophyceae sp. CCMP2097]|nr:hypothetical protein M885DRAFT_626072 [Pelagophyceae sp. CCMP2097]
MGAASSVEPPPPELLQEPEREGGAPPAAEPAAEAHDALRESLRMYAGSGGRGVVQCMRSVVARAAEMCDGDGDAEAPRRGREFARGDVIHLANARVEAFVGRGAFGDVYRVRRDRGGAVWAMKAVRLGAESRGAASSAQERRGALELDLCVEAAVALTLGPHRHVAALKFVTPDPRFPHELLVFSDFVEGATLARLLSSRASGLAEATDGKGALYQRPARDVEAMLQRLTRQLYRALDHVHGAGLLHGDVKPDNILVDARSASLKLADFGLAAVALGHSPLGALAAAAGDGVPRAELAGCTPTYASPESARLLGRLAAARNPLVYAALKAAHPASPATTDLWAAALVALQLWAGAVVADLWQPGHGECGTEAVAAYLARPLAPARVAKWAPCDVSAFLDQQHAAATAAAARPGAAAPAVDAAAVAFDVESLAQLRAALESAFVRGGSLDGAVILKACLPPFEDQRAFTKRSGLRPVVAARFRALLRTSIAPYAMPKALKEALRRCLDADALQRPRSAKAVLRILAGDGARAAPKRGPARATAAADLSDDAVDYSSSSSSSASDGGRRGGPVPRRHEARSAVRLSHHDASLVNLGNTLARGSSVESITAALQCYARVGALKRRRGGGAATAPAAVAARAAKLARAAALSLVRMVAETLRRVEEWAGRGGGWRSRAGFHALRLARALAQLGAAAAAEATPGSQAAPDGKPARKTARASAAVDARPGVLGGALAERNLGELLAAPFDAAASPGGRPRDHEPGAATVAAAEKRLVGARHWACIAAVAADDVCVNVLALRVYLRAAALVGGDDDYPLARRDARLATLEALRRCGPPVGAGKGAQARLAAFLDLQHAALSVIEQPAAGAGPAVGAADGDADGDACAPAVWLLQSGLADRWGVRRWRPLSCGASAALDEARLRKRRIVRLNGGDACIEQLVPLAVDLRAMDARAPAAAAVRVLVRRDASAALAGDGGASRVFARAMFTDAVRRKDVLAVTELADDEAFPPSWRPAIRAWVRGARAATADARATTADARAAPKRAPRPDALGDAPGPADDAAHEALRVSARRASSRRSSRQAVVERAAVALESPQELLAALGVGSREALTVASSDIRAVLNIVDERALRPGAARDLPPAAVAALGALLYAAVRQGDARAVDVLLQCGVDVDAPLERRSFGGDGDDGDDDDDARPIHIAAALGLGAVVTALLQRPCCVLSAKHATLGGDAATRTPLGHAAAAGHVGVVAQLVARVCDADPRSRSGVLADALGCAVERAIDIASREGEAVDALLCEAVLCFDTIYDALSGVEAPAEFFRATVLPADCGATPPCVAEAVVCSLETAAAALAARASERRARLAEVRDADALARALSAATAAAVAASARVDDVLSGDARRRIDQARRFLRQFGEAEWAAALAALAWRDDAPGRLRSAGAGRRRGSGDAAAKKLVVEAALAVVDASAADAFKLDSAAMQRRFLGSLPETRARAPRAAPPDAAPPPPGDDAPPALLRPLPQLPRVSLAAARAVRDAREALAPLIEAEELLLDGHVWAAALWAYVVAAEAGAGVATAYDVARAAVHGALARRAQAARALAAERGAGQAHLDRRGAARAAENGAARRDERSAQTLADVASVLRVGRPPPQGTGVLDVSDLFASSKFLAAALEAAARQAAALSA